MFGRDGLNSLDPVGAVQLLKLLAGARATLSTTAQLAGAIAGVERACVLAAKHTR